jgi:hypothetical protein
MNVTIKKSIKTFKVYIDGHLHISIPVKEYAGMQSWLDGDHEKYYHIDFYLKSQNIIHCEYEDRKLWEEILKQIDKSI